MSSQEVFDQPDEKRLPRDGSGHIGNIRAAIEAIAIFGAGTYSPMLAGYRLKKAKKQMHPCPGCGKPTNGTDQPTPQGHITSEYCFRCVTEGFSKQGESDDHS